MPFASDELGGERERARRAVSVSPCSKEIWKQENLYPRLTNNGVSDVRKISLEIPARDAERRLNASYVDYGDLDAMIVFLNEFNAAA